jgi:hypothetical protein
MTRDDLIGTSAAPPQALCRPNRNLAGLPAADFWAAKLACAEYDWDHYPDQFTRSHYEAMWSTYYKTRARDLEDVQTVRLRFSTKQERLQSYRIRSQAIKEWDDLKKRYDDFRALGVHATEIIDAWIDYRLACIVLGSFNEQCAMHEQERAKLAHQYAVERAHGVVRRFHFPRRNS